MSKHPARLAKGMVLFSAWLCLPLAAKGQDDPRLDARPDLPADQKTEYLINVNLARSVLDGSVFWIKMHSNADGPILEVGKEQSPLTWSPMPMHGTTIIVAPPFRDMNADVTVRLLTRDGKPFKATCLLSKSASDAYMVLIDPLLQSQSGAVGRYHDVYPGPIRSEKPNPVGLYLVCDPNYLQFSG